MSPLPNAELYRTRARILKALAHPTRLFLVDELARGESCVGDLTARVGADLSTVSRHLAVLRDAGLVSDDKRGAQVFYALRVPCVMGFFGCMESVLAESEALSAGGTGRSAAR